MYFHSEYWDIYIYLFNSKITMTMMGWRKPKRSWRMFTTVMMWKQKSHSPALLSQFSKSIVNTWIGTLINNRARVKRFIFSVLINISLDIVTGGVFSPAGSSDSCSICAIMLEMLMDFSSKSRELPSTEGSELVDGARLTWNLSLSLVLWVRWTSFGLTELILFVLMEK